MRSALPRQLKRKMEARALRVQTCIPSITDGAGGIDQICRWTVSNQAHSTQILNNYFSAPFSSFQRPFASVCLLPSATGFLFFFSNSLLAFFALCSFCTLLARRGFSRTTCLFLTRLVYIPCGSPDRVSEAWTYVGVKGASVLNFTR